MTNDRSWRSRVARGGLLVLAALVAAAGTALAATAQSGHPAKQDPGKKVAALQHTVVALRKENTRLQAFTPAGISRQLKVVKALNDKYQSVDQAKADGYVAGSPCETTPIDPEETSYGGGMGIHYINQTLMQGPPNPLRPPILVYAPAAGGGLQLVAAEWFKPDADQSTATDGDRPTLFGRAFDGPMQGHAPGMPIHYDLHVWLWKRNPSGTFAPWNPDVSCNAG
jgi:hypothetical protein